jgi:hypothetical protein
MIIIEKINIPQLDLEDQKITEAIELSIEIRENSIVYTGKFYADEPKNVEDKDLGWENVFNSFRMVAAKVKIAGIEKSWLPVAKKWTIYIFVDGMASDIKVYFKRESEAETFFDKLHKWLYE